MDPWAWSQSRSPLLVVPAPTPSSAENGPHGFSAIHTWIIGLGRNATDPGRHGPPGERSPASTAGVPAVKH